MKLSVTVYTHSVDCGDGSGRVSVFGTYAEALQSKREVMDSENEKNLSDEDVENDDDSYENGDLGEETMYFELVDGELKLAKPASFSTGNQ